MSIYNNSIPNPGDQLDISQPQLLQNFQQLDITMGVDHFDFSDGTVNNGKHNQVTLPEKASAPTTAEDEIALYSQEAGMSAEFFLRRESDGEEVQLSNGIPISGTAGQTFLPGGLLMKWGREANSSSATYIVTYPVGGDNKVFSAEPYSIQVTGIRASSSPGTNTDAWVVTGFSATGFTIFNNGTHNFGYLWMAIGPA